MVNHYLFSTFLISKRHLCTFSMWWSTCCLNFNYSRDFSLFHPTILFDVTNMNVHMYVYMYIENRNNYPSTITVTGRRAHDRLGITASMRLSEFAVHNVCSCDSQGAPIKGVVIFSRKPATRGLHESQNAIDAVLLPLHGCHTMRCILSTKYSKGARGLGAALGQLYS